MADHKEDYKKKSSQNKHQIKQQEWASNNFVHHLVGCKILHVSLSGLPKSGKSFDSAPLVIKLIMIIPNTRRKF